MARKSNASIWTLEPEKYLTSEEARRLLKTAAALAKDAKARRRKVAIRHAFIIHLALSTGLRVMEMSRLSCSDLLLASDTPAILVRKGKGGRRRVVVISLAFKKQCIEYLAWKRTIQESTAAEAPLILSSNTSKYMSTRGLQNAFKRVAQQARLPTHYSIHSLRHTYACMLYKASKYNLRLVQKQLGHASIETTQVYADAVAPDVTRAVQKLWK